MRSPPEADTEDKDLPLREDIRLLGRILGVTIREQGGEVVFETVENIRQNSVRFRRDEDLTARRDLEATLNGLKPKEALQIIHPLLRKGAVDFKGKYYEARECELLRRGPRRTGPPIMIGAKPDKPRALRLTAQYADYWNVFPCSQPGKIVPMLEAVDAACVKAGRDPATLQRTSTVLFDLPVTPKALLSRRGGTSERPQHRYPAAHRRLPTRCGPSPAQASVMCRSGSIPIRSRASKLSRRCWNCSIAIE